MFEQRRGGEKLMSDDEEEIDNSYDSEFEAEFFGKKDPNANTILDKLQSEQIKRQEEAEKLAEENEKKREEKKDKKRKDQLASENFGSNL